MSEYYFDSSALVKIYIAETGSDFVLDTINKNRIIVSSIAAVEVISAIVRRKHNKDLTKTQAQTAINEFRDDLIQEYYAVDVTPEIIEAASLLVEKHELRAYDAVQLATACNFKRSIGSSLVTFVCADDKLNEAAKVEGLSVENPNNH